MTMTVIYGLRLWPLWESLHDDAKLVIALVFVAITVIAAFIIWRQGDK